MSKWEGPPIAEIEEQIDYHEDKLKSIQRAIDENPDSNRTRMLEISMRNMRAELSNLKLALEDAKKCGEEDRQAVSLLKKDIEDRNSRIDEIDRVLENEPDKTARNNLEVSKRFLQMEINSLEIRISDATRKADVVKHEDKDKEIEELRRSNDARARMIADLQSRLSSAERDLSVAKALAADPEKVQCDETRVTVTSGRLNELSNKAAALGAENYDLKCQITKLKQSADMSKKDIHDLTIHCKNGDSQILELQGRIAALVEEGDAVRKKAAEIQSENEGLKNYMKDMKREGLR